MVKIGHYHFGLTKLWIQTLIKKGVSISMDGKGRCFDNILLLKNISKSAAPKIGDSVLTSPYSASFPAQLMLGRVTKVVVDPSSNFLTLELKSATNFYNLEFIYLVENKRMNEQLEVEKNKTPNE